MWLYILPIIITLLLWILGNKLRTSIKILFSTNFIFIGIILYIIPLIQPNIDDNSNVYPPSISTASLENSSLNENDGTTSSASDNDADYIITFIANDVIFNIQTFTPRVLRTLNGGTPARVGYTFAGWKKLTKSPIYKNGESIALTRNITLYATWKLNKEDDNTPPSASANDGNYIATFISYHNIVFSTQTFTPEVSNALNGGIPTRNGFTFVGWETSESSPTYYNGENIKLSKDVTFYAIWRAK